MSHPAEKSLYLFLTEGSSDKEYHLHLRQVTGGWTAYYANGPRGRVGSSKPVKDGVFTLEEASKHYADKLKTKLKDGYTESESGVRFTNTEKGDQASGHAQQLPTAITLEQANKLTSNDFYCVQEKANGERRSVDASKGAARGINKLGLYVNVPENIAQACADFGNVLFDAEQVGEKLYIFDLLRLNGEDLRGVSFKRRYETLEQILASSPADCLVLLRAYFTPGDKRALMDRVERDNGEGLVYKDVTAPYDGGRSGTVFKFKFKESSTCQVIGINQQRSVQLGLLNAAGVMIPVGNVTIPANHQMPAVGDLAEVEYLYYNPEGAFEQPVFLGRRNDVLAHEATLAQVTRLKPGVSMDEHGKRVMSEPDDETPRVFERQRA